ncbi:MAG: type II toxin-antitoxin system RelE/ParE family toxin [Deltaproteobacteria bacterium]|jgi:mRNA interferase RelE/StbE|nr:type II toxin-antitoxin system RelE/ParE family toxin [Deltaproteobacteria bacterium]
MIVLYNVILKPSVEKDLRSLPKSAIARVWKHIEAMKITPLPRQAVKLEGGKQLYRIRVGDYRIVYGVDNEAKQVTVYYVRHRREVYRKLGAKRYP